MPSSDPPSRSPTLTRRGLLAASAAAAALTAGPVTWKILRQPHGRVLASRVLSYDDDLVGRIREGIAAFPSVSARVRGASVLLKPNLVEVHPDRPINTDPRLIVAAAAAFLEAGAASVTVGEGPGHTRDTEAVLEQTGLESLLAPLRVPFLDLNIDDIAQVAPPANLTGLGTLPVARTIMAADLVVSMPKMKTHHWVGATLSMKNLFGTVPGAAVGWPKNPLHWAGIPNSVVDLWSAIRPAFAIVDGIVGMEGDGPIMGTAVPHGVLLFSDNLPAVDATAARLMGLRAERLPVLRMALPVGGTLHPSRIEVVGDEVPTHSYALIDSFSHLRA